MASEPPICKNMRPAPVTLRHVILTLLFFAAAASAYGWTFTPMVAEINLDSGQPRLTYTISNDSSQPIAVQISIARREISVDGEESRTPADEMLAYPSQLVVAGGESRTVIVEWSGSQTDVEIPYRVIAEQVPVDFGDDPEARARIKMNLRYVTSLYLRPPETAPEPVVVESTVAPLPADVQIGGGNGEAGTSGDATYAMVLVENRGDSRLNLEEVTYRLGAMGSTEAEAEVTAEETSAPVGVILPGGRRRIYVRLPERYAALEAGTPVAVTVAQ